MLIRIIRLDTTYLKRMSTNHNMCQIAMGRMAEEGQHKIVISFPRVHRKMKIKAACKCISRPNCNQYQTISKFSKSDKQMD